MTKHLKTRRSGAAIASIAMALALAMGPATSIAHAANDVPEWAVDGGGATAQTTSVGKAPLPAAFDLRTKGVVTPVKCQDPWQDCWAFGGIAAAEISILSDLGITYADTVQAGDPYNLSERHLAWFAAHPVTAVDDPEQVGEGTYTYAQGNGAYDMGGTNMHVTTLFSQGVGPVPESMFPYRGTDANGTSHTCHEAFEADPEKATMGVLKQRLNTDDDGVKVALEGMHAQYNAAQEAAGGQTMTYDEYVQFVVAQYVSMYGNNPAYVPSEDWSIPALGSDGVSNRIRPYFQVLKDGNVLPEYWNKDSTIRDDASLAAMKRELVAGHGICICIHGALPSDDTYLNTATWAQYTDNANEPTDHFVCVVGYDDSFAASNFKTVPPGDGAWIVKNSWGSETDAAEDDLGNWTGIGSYGIRNEKGEATGYFYLSYFDKTIKHPETLSFSTSLYGSTGQMGIFQHDYMTATDGIYTMSPTTDVMSSANVFNLEDKYGDQMLKSVATRTSGQGQHVTLAVYQMKDGATTPTDGTLLWKTSTDFAYAGFHRVDLEQPVRLSKGHKYAIVSTVSAVGEDGKRSYSVSVNQGFSKLAADYYRSMYDPKSFPAYDVAVVNKGESFLYRDGAWVDWSDYRTTIPKDTDLAIGDKYIDLNPLDNFSIKMYSEPATDSDVPSPVPDSGSSDKGRGGEVVVYGGRTRYSDYSSGSSSTTTSSGTSDAVKRVAGSDRYATMAALVTSAFTSSKGAIVASGTSFADALAAAALAGAHGWPVVITDPSTLSADASSVLSRLGASEVTVVGGPAAVSDAVVSQLGGARVSGTDRYATAIEAMKAVRAIDASSDTVVIATGSTFADALSIGPWAWSTKSPILLALPDGTLRQDVIDAIKADAGIKRVLLIGGPSVVSDAVRGQLGDGYAFERLGGADRYATSSVVASWAMSHGLGWKKPVVATGKGFADALAAAAVCGQNGSVLLLADSASAPTLALLRENASKVTSVMVAGGTAAVSETVDMAVREALR